MLSRQMMHSRAPRLWPAEKIPQSSRDWLAWHKPNHPWRVVMSEKLFRAHKKPDCSAALYPPKHLNRFPSRKMSPQPDHVTQPSTLFIPREARRFCLILISLSPWSHHLKRIINRMKSARCGQTAILCGDERERRGRILFSINLHTWRGGPTAEKAAKKTISSSICGLCASLPLSTDIFFSRVSLALWVFGSSKPGSVRCQ